MNQFLAAGHPTRGGCIDRADLDVRTSCFGRNTEAPERTNDVCQRTFVSCQTLLDGRPSRFGGPKTHPVNQNAKKPLGRRFLNKLRHQAMSVLYLISYHPIQLPNVQLRGA